MEKALQLETSLIKQWAADRQVPANVFQWLRFDHDVHYAFKVDNLKNRTTLMTLRWRSPHTKRQRLNYTQIDFKAMLPKVQEILQKITDGTVAELENGGKSVDDVVQIFQISTKEIPFITRQKLDLVEEFIKLTGREQDLISILSKTFGGGKPC
ncbi:RxLR effector protein [Phytophthora megakarya]|uniref:RxLR effector protein n=1 Tax=Phytophthora megakarya TaxID=4795 RepID=A0A225UJV1_9STRA|nr:RxLR effector protein [Phytophthora megakarya]